MSNVIQFTPTITLYVGISEERPKRRVYLLEYKDHRGSLIVWDGGSHAQALAEAQDFVDDGAIFVDETGASK